MLKNLLKVLSAPIFALGFLFRLAYLAFDFGGECGQEWVTRVFVGRENMRMIEDAARAIKDLMRAKRQAGGAQAQVKKPDPLDVN